LARGGVWGWKTRGRARGTRAARTRGRDASESARGDDGTVVLGMDDFDIRMYPRTRLGARVRGGRTAEAEERARSRNQSDDDPRIGL